MTPAAGGGEPPYYRSIGFEAGGLQAPTGQPGTAFFQAPRLDSLDVSGDFWFNMNIIMRLSYVVFICTTNTAK